MGGRPRRAWLLLLPMTLGLGACSLLAFDRDLTSLQALGSVSGTAETEDGSRRPTVVLLYALRDLETPLVDYEVLLKPGRFTFLRPPGRYVAAAFEDRNEDFAHQPGEPIGYAGLDDPLVVEKGGSVEGIGIRMSVDEKARSGLRLDLRDRTDAGELSPARRNVGVVASLDDHRFSRKAGSDAFLSPGDFVRRGGAGVFFLEPYDPARIPVIFVHGILGSPQDVRPLIEALDTERFQAWFFAYPSSLRLGVLSGLLAQSVLELGVTYDLRRLYVVAHSMGGLVSRAFIRSNAAEKKRELVQLFVSIATPFGGSDAARGARFLGRRAEVISWIDLVPTSPFLHDLYEEPLPDYVRHHLFFAYLKGSSEGKVDGVVSLTSQLDPRARAGARGIHPVEAGHVAVLSDPGVHATFREILDQAWSRDASALRPDLHARRTAPSLRSAEHFTMEWSQRMMADADRRARFERSLDTGLLALGELLSEPGLLEAVRAANRDRDAWSDAKLEAIDARWQEGETTGVTDAACDARLARFVADHPDFAEVLVTDARGANVCQSNPTSDFLQSDEGWWQRTAQTRKVWHAPLQYDASAMAFGVALHAPLAERAGATPLGVAKALLREPGQSAGAASSSP